TDDELPQLEKWLVKFYNELVELRKELKLVDLEQRQLFSEESLAGTNVMFYAYALLAKEMQEDKNWRQKLKRINNIFKYGSYSGDLLSVENPLWHNTICYTNNKNLWKSIDSNRTRSVVKNEMAKYFNVGQYSYQD